MSKSNELIKLAKQANNASEIDVSHLTPEQVEKCRELTKGIVDAQTLYSFGENLAEVQVTTSNKLLEMNKIDKAGEIGSKVTEVLDFIRDTKYEDPKNIKGFTGMLVKYLPGFGVKVAKRAEKTLVEKYSSSKDLVERVVNNIHEKCVELKEDHNTLQVMYENTVDYINQLYLLVVALEQKIIDTERELEDLKRPDNYDEIEVAEKSQLLDDMRQHQYNLFMLGATNKNVTLNEINMMKRNCLNLCKQAASMKSTVIPNWKTTISMALINSRAKETSDQLKMISDANNDMIVANAKLARTINSEVQEQSNRGSIDVESYVAAYEEIMKAAEETLEASNKASKIREENIKKVQEITQKNEEIVKRMLEEKTGNHNNVLL